MANNACYDGAPPPPVNIETELIYCGDCLDVMKDKIPDEVIDLIYLDPPFFSKKDYETIWIKDKMTSLHFADSNWKKHKDKVDPQYLKEYEEIEKRWRGGKNGIYVYMAYMRERVNQCYRVLKDTGSIYLHCDWHASHYLRMVMDEVFGYDNFLNEIVWFYSGGLKNVGKQFPRKHDVILFYRKTKDRERVFNVQRKKITKEVSLWQRWGKFSRDGQNVRLAEIPLTDIINRQRQIDKFKRKHGRKPKPDDILYTLEGKLVESVWDDCSAVYRKRENTKFPTQKPEALLNRIIKTSSDKGDIVLDPFCGCGTTLASAKSLKRRWIGIDISKSSADVVADRFGSSVKVIGCESPEELASMDPHDFARLIIVEKMKGIINKRKSGDLGIDGWVELREVPVQVKRWKHKVGRPEIDKFKTAVERDKRPRGIIVAKEFSSEANNEVERIKNAGGIEIELKTVAEIFGWE